MAKAEAKQEVSPLIGEVAAGISTPGVCPLGLTVCWHLGCMALLPCPGSHQGWWQGARAQKNPPQTPTTGKIKIFLLSTGRLLGERNWQLLPRDTQLWLLLACRIREGKSRGREIVSSPDVRGCPDRDILHCLVLSSFKGLGVLCQLLRMAPSWWTHERLLHIVSSPLWQSSPRSISGQRAPMFVVCQGLRDVPASACVLYWLHVILSPRPLPGMGRFVFPK